MNHQNPHVPARTGEGGSIATSGAAQSEQPAGGPMAPRKLGGSGLLAIVLGLTILLTGIFLGIAFLMWNKAVIDAPTKMSDAIGHTVTDALRPKININEIVFSSLENMKRQEKLVVLDATVNADVTREEGNTSWGIYWGTNVARVAVKGARVQYYIDLTGLNTGDYDYDEKTRTLTITVPPPRLDTQMISIDPAKIQTLDLRGGWARWDKQATRQDAIAELRPKVIIEANKPIMRKEAREAGRQALGNFLTPLMQTLQKDGVTLNIVYQNQR